MAKINNEQIEEISKILGRSIIHEEGAYQDFARIPQSNLKEAEKLTRGDVALDAVLYIIFLVGEKCSLRNASSFVENVIVKKQHQRIGSILIIKNKFF